MKWRACMSYEKHPPRLSVILAAVSGESSVAPVVEAWERQTRRDAIEVLVTVPEGVSRDEDWMRVIVTGEPGVHANRMRAYEESKGEYVMVGEDHCLPDPDYVKMVLPRLDEGWDAVAPALRCGNPRHSSCQAEFAVAYGEWMEPIATGVIALPPGVNVAMRRAALEGMGERLHEKLMLATFAMLELRKKKARFYLESNARMRHFNLETWDRSVRCLWAVGQGFGYLRTRDWPGVMQLGFPLLAPLVALMHWRRGLRQYLRAGRQIGYSWRCVPGMALLSIVWAAGEAVGALRSDAAINEALTVGEVKPVSAGEVLAAERMG
jgi:hypothetical protein